MTALFSVDMTAQLFGMTVLFSVDIIVETKMPNNCAVLPTNGNKISQQLRYPANQRKQKFPTIALSCQPTETKVPNKRAVMSSKARHLTVLTFTLFRP